MQHYWIIRIMLDQDIITNITLSSVSWHIRYYENSYLIHLCFIFSLVALFVMFYCCQIKISQRPDIAGLIMEAMAFSAEHNKELQRKLMTKELQNSSTMVDLKHIPSLPTEDQAVHEVQQETETFERRQSSTSSQSGFLRRNFINGAYVPGLGCSDSTENLIDYSLD
ncbi:uncharacterized protein LOC111705439 [Eurytemora carolleeae]|uniref:uncharacterized protein LOC111705439 n=1 Tax=Eurytemora carolleeae TaxID=1294199 RepID=UPI000C7688C1|nr:uncharacterized protein LOC111705439 [Eurytemora carolleeae]|eukprot:XP_023333762.1 uncharacterized protein LOC111705439 [Eurytemora affinis]